jgi:hypothetical protein
VHRNQRYLHRSRWNAGQQCCMAVVQWNLRWNIAGFWCKHHRYTYCEHHLFCSRRRHLQYHSLRK